MVIAVVPIARPMSSLRPHSLGNNSGIGEASALSKVANTPAAIINDPKQKASIRYSRQCCCKVCRIAIASVDQRV